MIKTAEQIIVEILKSELSLGDDNVWVRNQNRTIPPSSGLFIVVGMTDSRPVSAQSYLEEKFVRLGRIQTEYGGFLMTEAGDYLASEDSVLNENWEIQRVQTMDAIQIDIFSRDNSALFRRWEVLAALRSIASRQSQEGSYFKISRLPSSFLNTSAAEGGSNLNRYSITFNCLVWFKKEKILTGYGYYDDFKTQVDDAITIETETPLIEFDIASDYAEPNP